MENAKVLLVDDEVEFTNTLSERLSDRGYKVDSAENGVEAIDKASKSNYDVIFLDLAMPGIDGIETLKKIIDKNPNLQIYLLTGHATLEKGVEAIKFGAQDVIEKPVNIDKLLAKINEAQTKKIALLQQESEIKIHDILKTKGW